MQCCEYALQIYLVERDKNEVKSYYVFISLHEEIKV